MKELTEKQTLVLNALRSYISEKGYAPTLRELMELLKKVGMELASLNSLAQYLAVLEEKGFIQRFPKVRGIRLLEGDIENFVEIPLVGSADCGEPLHFADDCIEDYINISKKIIKDSKENYFFVRAVGDSMDKAGINDSDYVLIKKIARPFNGDNVLAVINGLGTIKQYRESEDTIALIPRSNNPKHKPIILHSDDQIYICGKVERTYSIPI